MSLPQVHRLRNILTANPDIVRCTHPSRDDYCIERGKITCFDDSLTFWHVRFDPCMCQNPDEQQQTRCDCIIFAFDPTKRKQGMFVVEVKDTYNKPTLGQVKDKIQYCINRMQAILGGHMNSLEVFPILCDEKHSGLCTQASMIDMYKVRCYGKPKSVILNSYAKNIVSYYRNAVQE